VRPDDTFYSWSALDSRGDGAAGVTADRSRAGQLLAEALKRLAPDATGICETVWLDRSARQPSYVHGPVVARLRRSAG